MTAHPGVTPLHPVTRVTETVLPTGHGTFRLVGYLGDDGTEHVALVMEDPAGERTSGGVQGPAPLVRLHSECLTGDAFGSLRCDCGQQLDAALARIATEGDGVVVYVRGHEGRGIGLLEKLKAYRLQDGGADTVDANLALGHPTDARDYTHAAAILADLGVTRIRLMSSNPAKEEALVALGIDVVERTGMFVPEAPPTKRYLRTKRSRMRHDSPPPAGAWDVLLDGEVPVSVVTPADAELVDRYGPLVSTAAEAPLVLAQMAQSLDGFIATPSGDGEALSGTEDHVHLHRLRALVDAVVVGAGTVVADDPRLTVREVAGEHPVRVVIDPHARIPLASSVLRDGAAPTMWLVEAGAEVPPVDAHVEVVGLEPEAFEPARLLGLLRARGLDRVLVEGGGRTVSRFLRAGCIDRLFVTSVPVLLGDGVRGVRVPASEHIADAERYPSRRFALGEDVCTELILR